ncbi:MAG: aminodeoxychorismate synthase component I [Kiritimatiellae bacterium]|nr:aminodeoxychorismate synthase component I [Kiritimatiellia bacterium]
MKTKPSTERNASESTPSKGLILLQTVDQCRQPCWLQFSHPQKVITTYTSGEVVSKLQEIEQEVNQGYYAAGFLSYEAAPAFDIAMKTKSRTDSCPLLWFGLYKSTQTIPLLTPPSCLDFTLSAWKSSTSFEEYKQNVNRIKEYIAAGDTYQVNYTMKRHSTFQGDPLGLFHVLYKSQQVNHSAYVDIGDYVFCSASPELFFRLDGLDIECKPMKGTAPRGRFLAEDKDQAQWLADSLKNRAENLMIVDTVRNDLGRCTEIGSIEVPSLFHVERYKTLFQMTSTIVGKTDASITEIFQSLFPCASITGSPKIRTMEIIAELEEQTRGIYTGCIGYIAPHRRAQFNIAIRTVEIDRESNRASYGLGGGIVWDSDPKNEYDECCTKALVLKTRPILFELLETVLWKPQLGHFLLDKHLLRLEQSAIYFDIPIDIEHIKELLLKARSDFGIKPHKVRLLVNQKGQPRVEAEPLNVSHPHRRWKIALALNPVNPNDRFLYHKTTQRDVYQSARESLSAMDDVILWNSNEEITESCFANLVIRKKDKLITPFTTCGLLAGTYRDHLLDTGKIEEGIIHIADLKKACTIYLINSVRGWILTDHTGF